VYGKSADNPSIPLRSSERVQPCRGIVELAKAVREELAEKFPRPVARLYSQHNKLRAGQPGLRSWKPEEFWDRLDDAVRLLEAAFLERKALQGDTWRNGVQRTGELLEWLTHIEMNRERLPLGMLSAAAYQLAGYPARANGILREHGRDDKESKILYALLQADFQRVLRELTTYWGSATIQNMTGFDFSETSLSVHNFQSLVVKETASALGVLCAAMRWGNEARLEQALEKLSTVSKMLLHGQDFYSWLLAKLCAEVIATYAATSLRVHLSEFFC